MKISLLLILLLLSGCSTGHISLSPRNCEAKTASWEIEESEKDFFFEHSIWFASTVSETPEIVRLKDILEVHDIDCRNLKAINFSVKNTLWDNIVSLMPFMSRSTFIFEGSLRVLNQSATVTEDGEAKDRQL